MISTARQAAGRSDSPGTATGPGWCTTPWPSGKRITFSTKAPASTSNGGISTSDRQPDREPGRNRRPRPAASASTASTATTGKANSLAAAAAADRGPGPAETVRGREGESEQAQCEHRQVVAAGGQGQRADRQHGHGLDRPDPHPRPPHHATRRRPARRRSPRRTTPARRSTRDRRRSPAAARKPPFRADTGCSAPSRSAGGSAAIASRARGRASRRAAGESPICSTTSTSSCARSVRPPARCTASTINGTSTRPPR